MRDSRDLVHNVPAPLEPVVRAWQLEALAQLQILVAEVARPSTVHRDAKWKETLETGLLVRAAIEEWQIGLPRLADLCGTSRDSLARCARIVTELPVMRGVYAGLVGRMRMVREWL